jgi:hypothetical protein
LAISSIALVQQECAVRDTHDRHACERPNGACDAFTVLGVGTRDRHVAHDRACLDAHEIDRTEYRAVSTDRRRDPCERPGLLLDMDAHREAVGG